MSEKRTIARPYARALFADVADKDAQTAQALAQLLDVLAQAVVVTEIEQAIKNPSVADEQVIQLLVAIAEDANAAACKQFGTARLTEWLTLFCAAKRLDVMPDIAQLFNAECAKQQGAMDIVISSAEPLSDTQKEAIIKKLSAKWHKTIQANYEIDSSLLGGVRIQAGDWVLDRSIADKLLRLSEDIQS